ncbi:MAG: RrF2 family transcriptional regulator [Paracoccaceae bacterium]
MRLTKFSDYALRVLILAASRQGQNVTIDEAAHLYGISAPHLKKVVRALTGEGYLKGTRGRAGGFRLAKPPEEINLGQVVRTTEPDFALVECFQPGNACGITCACKLPPILNRMLNAMLDVMGEYTLADLIVEPRALEALPISPQQQPMPLRGPRISAG